MKVVITTSGIGKRLGNYTEFNNKTLVRIGNKFTICYIIEKYPKESEFIITLGYYGDFVKQFLIMAYPDYNFTFINIDKYEGKGSSLGYSLLQTKDSINSNFIYHCCDCIFLDNIIIDEITEHNCMFVYKGENNSNNYNIFSSVNVGNKFVSKVNDKGETNSDFFYIGVAHIKNYKLFFEILELYVNNNYYNESLSDIHIYKEFLKKSININYKVINNWYDMGTLTTFNNANEYLTCSYNILYKQKESICFLKDYVIKFFFDNTINQNRVKRGQILKNLVPNIIEHSNNYYKMELIDGKLMSEYYQYGEIYKLLNWSQEKMWSKIGDLDEKYFKSICKKFYYNKTMERINKFMINNNDKEYNTINGLEVGTINELISKIDFDLLSDSIPSHFHGDFILDNILKVENEFCLLDWRQDFCGELEYGDMYYDLGKLQHNIILNHNNLENNMFYIKETNNGCELDIKCNYFLIQQLKDFNKFIEEKKYNKKKIDILTSLIWINMAPLHEYPLSIFLFHFGKYNLHLNLQS